MSFAPGTSFGAFQILALLGEGSSPTQGRSYALTPDGQRFLMMKGEGRLDSDGGAAEIVWVQNWSSEVARASATK
jgi:hypothetical protein